MDAFLAVEYAVYDWTCLRLFTGSRIAENAQMRLKATGRYNAIPTMGRSSTGLRPSGLHALHLTA
jgi:hypothetical protein